MSIVRRKPVSEQSKGARHRLRHPKLKPGSTCLMIYSFIRQHPGCKYRDFSHLSRSGQPLSDLVNEGLVRVEGEKRSNYSYFAVPENAVGPGRDIVEVEVTLFVNAFGEYSINAKLVGQKLTAHEDFPQELLRKSFKIAVPMPNEPYAPRPMVDLNEMQTFAKPQEAEFVDVRAPLTIDGDYEILPPEK